ncbi:unnamed protein product [Clonostachys rosea f. rosea IK726]|uniref:Uncharacterized protein n=1 Tax=Clonostachys rosea f. rosea IK726 TaxID=1349383 RepID=A0ACA9UCL3_BIOOC|nr:unnamed protein product [Clonostachys rosea f. rosea IK726]
MSQTPPGYKYSTDQALTVTVANAAVAPGSYVPIQTLREPVASPGLDFSNIPSGSAHVVVMLDLDPPLADEDRKYAPLLHWLTAIPSGVSSLAANDTTTEAIAPYVPPQPPAGSAPHRYVTLLLKDTRDKFSAPAGFEGPYEDLFARVNFDLDGFIKAGGFEIEAAHWFTTKPAE